MICMNYDHNKKFGLLKFHSGYGKFYFNSLKGNNRKIINAQTEHESKTYSITFQFTDIVNDISLQGL